MNELVARDQLHTRLAALLALHGRRLPEGFDPALEAHFDAAAGALLQIFRDGDDLPAFELLVELSQRRLHVAAHRIARKFAMALDPDDLVAVFLARLYTDVRRDRPPVKRFLALARTAMRHDALNQLRQYKRAQARHAIWGRERQAERFPDAQEFAERAEQSGRLARLGTFFVAVTAQCFHELRERERRVLLARDVDGLSYDEVGEALALPRAQVGMVVKRAREQLARKISDVFARHGQPVPLDEAVPWEAST